MTCQLWHVLYLVTRDAVGLEAEVRLRGEDIGRNVYVILGLLLACTSI